MIAVRVENLSKRFRLRYEKNRFGQLGLSDVCEEFYALKNVSFEVKAGECLGIIGRNGSGKTTLLKIIAGIYQPTSGEVFVNGDVMSFLELGVGFEPELTGRENIYIYGSLLGLPKKEIERKFNKIVKYAQLEKFIDTKLKNYSTGMQVRLAFATAMMNNPDILLIDEVLAVGDESFQKKSFNHIRDLKKAGKTMIIVSHSLEQIRQLCDRTIVLDKGQIVFEGKSDEVIPKYLEKIRAEDFANVKKEVKNKVELINSVYAKRSEVIKKSKDLKDKGFFKRLLNSGLKRKLDSLNSQLDVLKEELYMSLVESERLIKEQLRENERLSASLLGQIREIESDGQKEKAAAYKKKLDELVKGRFSLQDGLREVLLYKLRFDMVVDRVACYDYIKELLYERLRLLRKPQEQINLLLELKRIIRAQLLEAEDETLRDMLTDELKVVLEEEIAVRDSGESKSASQNPEYLTLLPQERREKIVIKKPETKHLAEIVTPEGRNMKTEIIENVALVVDRKIKKTVGSGFVPDSDPKKELKNLLWSKLKSAYNENKRETYNHLKRIITNQLERSKDFDEKKRLFREFRALMHFVDDCDKRAFFRTLFALHINEFDNSLSMEEQEGCIKELFSLVKGFKNQLNTLDPKMMNKVQWILRKCVDDQEYLIYQTHLKKQSYSEQEFKERISDLEKRKNLFLEYLSEFNRSFIVNKTIPVKREKEVVISSVKFLDDKNRLTKTFTTGSTLKICIEYVAKKKIERPVFGVGIRRDDGTHITGPNTKFHHFDIDSIIGRGKVIYEIERLPLLDGKYYVSVSIHPYDSLEPFDIHDNAYIFEVKNKGIKEFGIFHIPCVWRHEKN